MPDTQLESAIDVDAVLNELEHYVETLHGLAELARSKNMADKESAYNHALHKAMQTQAAITRLVLNDLTVA